MNYSPEDVKVPIGGVEITGLGRTNKLEFAQGKREWSCREQDRKYTMFCKTEVNGTGRMAYFSFVQKTHFSFSRKTVTDEGHLRCVRRGIGVLNKHLEAAIEEAKRL